MSLEKSLQLEQIEFLQHVHKIKSIKKNMHALKPRGKGGPDTNTYQELCSSTVFRPKR